MVGTAGAAAIIAGCSALVIAVAGFVAARKAGDAARPPATPPDASLIEMIMTVVRDRPLLSAGAAVAAGIYAAQSCNWWPPWCGPSWTSRKTGTDPGVGRFPPDLSGVTHVYPARAALPPRRPESGDLGRDAALHHGKHHRAYVDALNTLLKDAGGRRTAWRT